MTPYVWVFFSEPTGMALVVRKCDYMPTVSPDHRRGYWKKAVIEEYQPPTPAASDPVTENIVSNNDASGKRTCHYELVKEAREYTSKDESHMFLIERLADALEAAAARAEVAIEDFVLAKARAERYRVALQLILDDTNRAYDGATQVMRISERASDALELP